MNNMYEACLLTLEPKKHMSKMHEVVASGTVKICKTCLNFWILKII